MSENEEEVEELISIEGNTTESIVEQPRPRLLSDDESDSG